MDLAETMLSSGRSGCQTKTHNNAPNEATGKRIWGHANRDHVPHKGCDSCWIQVVRYEIMINYMAGQARIESV